MWDIKICRVNPPYLHVLLGIVKKHNDFLEDQLHAIDIEIAKEIASSKAVLGSSVFDRYVGQLRTHKKKITTLTELQQKMGQEGQDWTEKQRQSASSKIKKLQIESKIQPKLHKHSGPMISSLQKTLK